jgi:PQQ enzyme-like repeat protein
VAPADCERIFALDAMSGKVVWALPAGSADDVVHLLGIADDVLLASGDALYWIDAYTGRLITQFPHGPLAGPDQSAPINRGYGRGVIAGTHVWWPTRETIFAFETRPSHSGDGPQPRLVRQIPLAPRGVTGGNLVIANGVLLIANRDKLVAFGE